MEDDIASLWRPREHNGTRMYMQCLAQCNSAQCQAIWTPAHRVRRQELVCAIRLEFGRILEVTGHQTSPDSNIIALAAHDGKSEALEILG